MTPARRARLSDGRWHLQHGPIDIVAGADGESAAVAAAHEAAWRRFVTVLAELVRELPQLRARVAGACPLHGAVARRMWQACQPLSADFITPMAAVAGSVAEELIACYERKGVARAWVNNGGDIALHLAPGQSLRVGLYADLARFDAGAARDALGVGRAGGLSVDGHFDVHGSMPVRGVATSGWRGRSLSRGIADSVTVLAASAAMADAAATVIANAVDVDDPAIVRRSACSVRDDSDLGERLVTVDVPVLGAAQVQQALQRGTALARQLQARGLVVAALLACQGSLARLDPQDRARVGALSLVQ
jgi:hypothetical protein